jgi:hypothetical protein
MNGLSQTFMDGSRSCYVMGMILADRRQRSFKCTIGPQPPVAGVR